MRILDLQTIAQWTGNIEENAYLQIPEKMDVAAEERSWFNSGGGELRDFVTYLIANGARELTNVETWVINYQS